MSFEAYMYLIPALFAIFWPMLLMFFKREVMAAQWILMGGLFMVGITMALYSTFFMAPFHQEHLLCHLYVIMALLSPVLLLAGILKLSTVEGFSKDARRFVIFPVSAIVIITVVAQLGGFNNYQEFLANVVHGGDLSMRGDFWYDAMIIVEFYGFLAALAVEIVLVFCYVFPCVRKYVKLMEDNFVSPPRSVRMIKPVMTTVFVLILLLVLLEVNYPLHTLTSRFVLVLVCIMQTSIVFFLGYYVYHLRYSAEQLVEMKRDAEVVNDQFQKMGMVDQVTLEQVSEDVRFYLEDSKGCLDPTVTVFKLARNFHIEQDLVVRAIHYIKGTSFADYVNSLRIQYAMSVVMERLDNGMRLDNPYEQRKFTDSLAASCGYPDTTSFYVGFAQVMGMPFNTWMNSMVDNHGQN